MKKTLIPVMFALIPALLLSTEINFQKRAV